MLAAAAEGAGKDIAAAFVQFDSGAKGYLTRHEIRAAHLSLLGHAPSLLELDALAPKPKPEGEAREGDASAEARAPGVALPELCDWLERKLGAQDADELTRKAFRAFDTQGRGFIGLDDLEAVMAEVAPHVPAATVRLIFSQADANRDGRVSFRDFASVMGARPIGSLRG